MSRILFVMLHPGFIRYYDGALEALADAGHHVHVAFEISRDKLQEDVLAQRLASCSERITCGATPRRAESVREFLARGDRSATRSGHARPKVDRRAARAQAWESLATTLRVVLDYVRFFDPVFASADKLRERAEKRVPRVYVPVVRRLAAHGRVRTWLTAVLARVEQIVPTPIALDAFLMEHRPDLLLVTPLIELGSQQVDYVKGARRLGIRSALCVASWDNLTSKGLIRVVPDHVVVWNDAQKAEAVSLHGVPEERVVVTGAQLFDRWFDAKPSQSREAFCRRMGLDPDRPFVLYVGSSIFIAPEEVPFAERWLASLRASGDPVVSEMGVLIRPHPANSQQWQTFDAAAWTGVGIWPPIGSAPNAPETRTDYFDSLFYSAAVVGINTSAQLEAGIVGRPVFTIRAAEFSHAQEGTLHFQHLVDPESGVVQAAATLDEHVEQLRRTLSGHSDAVEVNGRFVRSFIRPFGADVAATPVFARAITRLAGMAPPLAEAGPRWASLVRPLMYPAARIARTLSEERPLWVYLVRPCATALAWTEAGAYWTRSTVRERRRLASKRLARGVHRVWYESTRTAAKRWRRVQGRARRVLAAASSAHRKG